MGSKGFLVILNKVNTDETIFFYLRSSAFIRG
jgi:hypothetical protein